MSKRNSGEQKRENSQLKITLLFSLRCAIVYFSRESEKLGGKNNELKRKIR